MKTRRISNPIKTLWYHMHGI